MVTQQEREARIEHWMTTIVGDGGVERYDDLHIDEIDANWANRDQWVRAAFEAFRMAVGLRELHKLPLVVVLAFSLEAGEQQRGIDFETVDEFQSELDWSPPSLYLLPAESVPWAGGEALPLDAGTMFDAQNVKGCYYMEFKQPGSAEYSRSVLLAN
jgi:hypothetical protein